jgi:hypothetical protein
MLWKNYTRPSLFGRFPVRIGLDCLAAFRELVKGEWAACRAIIKAHAHFWIAISGTNRKRKILQQKRLNHSNPQAMQRICIAWQYFIKKIRHFKDLPN